MSEEQTNDGTAQKVIIPGKFKHSISDIAILGFDDDTARLRTYVGDFHLEIMPTQNYSLERVERVLKFIKNCHGMILMSTVSPYTPYFVTGKFNNATMEIPMENFTMYEALPFIFYKATALLADAGDITYFEFNQKSPSEIAICVNVDDMRDINPFVDVQEWVDTLNMPFDDVESLADAGSSEIQEIEEPWWNRDNGEVRDFFEGITEEDLNVVKFNVDLGELSEEELAAMTEEESKKLSELKDGTYTGGVDGEDDQPKPKSKSSTGKNKKDDDDSDGSGPTVANF